ncbi:dihydrofolate reductase [Bhargavaea beijingensis]|uniref:Dihydrofolate reductase n=1 Tax=Bhargavaea beijingensis TaxID=426756 RepID=A0A1G7DC53_9BACL|nr:dihydrofolate reductase [Bhargavaea beijingensis]MCW1929146.1 dihydrofolate reductase [Bhargavaea beijingensis]RSK30957.1 dihydrofolate reductase [Bhargavaea beijingensis]SDE49248.1 dihydrofolate reductase [Bhargavaea beijingensis]
MISYIVAHDPNLVIGKDNQLPWHLPGDLAYFKKQTMGKAMVMGRKTFESIGRPLPGRLNIVVTRNPEYQAEGAVVVNSVDEAISRAEDYAPEVMVIGGAGLFDELMERADRLYITLIRKPFDGDTYFPDYKEGWVLVSQSEEHESDDGIRYDYRIYERKKTL